MFRRIPAVTVGDVALFVIVVFLIHATLAR
jgi:hypothetical protein